MTAILFSLPGSPVLYYGDEIAMGDNIFLGDRDGVRTPMQWTVDRNGGFSHVDFAQLYPPPLMDPVYGFQAVNVEAQAVELDLSLYSGRYPVELFGRSRFPRIGELSYLLTLAPRGFYWFQLVEEGEEAIG